MGNLGDHKALGGGLSEFRIAHGPGYRIYFTRFRDQIILLLVGGHKSSQPKDIEKAKHIIKQIGDYRED
ncbi:MAG: type II toxin-antitoxin system RelE/ParE family toxin [Chitinispirillaceae bacterium]